MSKTGLAEDVTLSGRGMRIAILAARWNAPVVDALVSGAETALARCGVHADDVQMVRVPGAFELPVVAAHLARSGTCDAVICLGAVIRGDTPHFDYVAGPVAHQLAALAVETGVPVAFGVLTCDTTEQELERAEGDVGNKGEEAALAAVETVTAIRTLQG